MKNKKIVIIIIIIAAVSFFFAIGIGISLFFLINVNYSKVTYVPDEDIEAIYRQMIKPDGSFDPFRYDEKLVSADELGAILLGAQHCEFIAPEVPMLSPDCPALAAYLKYRDHMFSIMEFTLMPVVRNLAFHPDERVRYANMFAVIPFLGTKPDRFYEYLNNQKSEALDLAAYRFFHHDERWIFSTAILKNSPKTQAFYERLKDSRSPYLRSMAYEENMTPGDIVYSVKNTKEGVKSVFHSETIMTAKEAEAVLLLFSRCQINDSDLSLDGDCFALDVYDEMLNGRLYLSDELKISKLIRKLSSHENPVVRGIILSLTYHRLPKKLEQSLASETDVKAIAAFVHFSKLIYQDTEELEPYFEKLKAHDDPRVRALFEVEKLTAEAFESHLLPVVNCADKDNRCPQLLEFSAWFDQYSDLSIKEKAEIAPVLDKYFSHDSSIVRMIAVTYGMTMAYDGLMPRPFAEYGKLVLEDKDDDFRMAVVLMFVEFAQADPEGAGSDADLKAYLHDLENHVENQEYRAMLAGMIDSVFSM